MQQQHMQQQQVIDLKIELDNLINREEFFASSLVELFLRKTDTKLFFIFFVFYIFRLSTNQELAPVFQYRTTADTFSWLPEGHRACLLPLLYKIRSTVCVS